MSIVTVNGTTATILSVGAQGPTGPAGPESGLDEDARLIAWTESETYEATAVTRDADGVPTTATVKWPDESAGVFTLVTKNSTWLAVDAYTVSHTDSGKTVTQAAVTRDALGNITTKPALTVA